MAMTDRVTEFWTEQLKNLHSLETQIVAALPGMALASRSEEVQEFFRRHRIRAKGLALQLEKILAEVAATPGDVTCGFMQRLVGEWEEMTNSDSFSIVEDVMLLRAVRKAIHQEIARYAKVVHGARVLGYDDLAEMLQQTLDEEIEVDASLAKLGRGLHREVQRFLAA